MAVLLQGPAEADKLCQGMGSHEMSQALAAASKALHSPVLLPGQIQEHINMPLLINTVMQMILHKA